MSVWKVSYYIYYCITNNRIWKLYNYLALNTLNSVIEDFESPTGVTAGASSSHDTSMEGERPSNGSGVRSSSTVRKGLLWQQRDKIFSQWKERYFILTPDYLQCFKKGTSRIT